MASSLSITQTSSEITSPSDIEVDDDQLRRSKSLFEHLGDFEDVGTETAANRPSQDHELEERLARSKVASLSRPQSSGSLDRFTSLQKWEGIVLDVDKRADSFVARLIDLTADLPDEEAEFPFDEVSPSDRALIVPGAVFYWNVAYRDTAGGQRKRESDIRFRRLPNWRKEDLEKSKAEARRLRDLLGWK